MGSNFQILAQQVLKCQVLTRGFLLYRLGALTTELRETRGELDHTYCLFVCFLFFAVKMKAKFHLCLLLIILGTITMQGAVTGNKKRTPWVLLPDEVIMVSVLSIDNVVRILFCFLLLFFLTEQLK